MVKQVKYVVRLEAEERQQLLDLVTKGKRAASVLTRARSLLKAEGGGQDADPRGSLIGRFTSLSAAEVSYAIELCLAVLVEFSAAFGLFLALEGAKDRSLPPPATVDPKLEVVQGANERPGKKQGSQP